MQGLTVTIILIFAVAYLGRRIYSAMASAADPCHGCKGCALRNRAKQARTGKRRKPAECPK